MGAPSKKGRRKPVPGKYRVIWECTLHGVKGPENDPAWHDHKGHPAGWKLEGNQHREIDRFDPDHPDKEKGFAWLAEYYEWKDVPG